MKYCPVCGERFDEDIIRFCTKDGTPLIEEAQPNFTTLPSEAAEESVGQGEETIVRKKPVPSAPRSDDADLSGRIVIPTATSGGTQPVRQRTAATYTSPPPPQNTAKTVVLTILGTLAVVGFGAGLFWFLSGGTNSSTNIFENQNVLANQNVNINTNLGFDSNFNFNSNYNVGNFNTNLNTNINSNLKSPTPSPSPRTSPTPSPTPSPSPDRSATPERSPTPRPSPTISTQRPAVSPTVRFTPRPTTPNSNVG
jgi:hypothetical protein